MQIPTILKRKFVFFVLALLSIVLITNGCKQNKGKQSKPEVKDQKKVIGIATFVDHVVLNTIRDGFMAELKAGGYTKESGWNITILNANGNPIEAASVADQLLNLQPAVLVSLTTPATKPLFEKNNGRYPMVFSFVSFPESIGIKEKAPNVTGLSDAVDFDLLLTLVRDTLPDVKRIGMVFSDEPNARVSYDKVKALVKAAGLEFSSQSVSKEEEVRGAIEALMQQPKGKRPQAILVGADGVVTNKITALLDVTNAGKVPVFAVDDSSVEKGALAGLSVNYTDFGKETAKVTMRILKGEKPESIPMNRYVAKDVLVNNLAAKKIGVVIPPKVAKQAVRVIQ